MTLMDLVDLCKTAHMQTASSDGTTSSLSPSADIKSAHCLCTQSLRYLCMSMQTLAYLLPVMSLAVQRGEKELQELQAKGKAHQAGSLQAIIVAPSRELAMQIVRVGQSLLPEAARGCVQQAIGGANPHRQVSP